MANEIVDRAFHCDWVLILKTRTKPVTWHALGWIGMWAISVIIFMHINDINGSRWGHYYYDYIGIGCWFCKTNVFRWCCIWAMVVRNILRGFSTCGKFTSCMQWSKHMHVAKNKHILVFYDTFNTEIYAWVHETGMLIVYYSVVTGDLS